eukprot:scaffold131458_cov70-Attheya_sp.AAC.1
MSKSAPACCCRPCHSTMICKSVGRAHLSTQSRNSSFRIGKECPSGQKFEYSQDLQGYVG